MSRSRYPSKWTGNLFWLGFESSSSPNKKLLLPPLLMTSKVKDFDLVQSNSTNSKNKESSSSAKEKLTNEEIIKRLRSDYAGGGEKLTMSAIRKRFHVGDKRAKIIKAASEETESNSNDKNSASDSTKVSKKRNSQ